MALNPVTQFDDLGLSDELKLLQESVRRFTEERVKPIGDEYFWQERQVPDSLLREMAQLGYFSIGVMGEAGRLGNLGQVVMREELSRGWYCVGSIVVRNIGNAILLLKEGTEEQKSKYLEGLTSGELLAQNASTEPDAGSDVASLKTTAVKDGSWYVINGTKMFASFANKANLVFLLVRTDPKVELKHRGVSCLIVEKTPGDSFDPPGFTGKAIPILGRHGNGTFELSFQDYRVPVNNLLGGEAGLNRGFYQRMSGFERTRTMQGAGCVGVARAAYELAVSYALNRVQFGYPIANFQAQRFRIAEMAVDIMTAKRLVYDIARRLESGQRCDLEAGMVKLFVTEMAVRCTDATLQIHAGYGYSKSPVARYWLDARLSIIGDGTSDIIKRLISDRILGKPSIPQ